MGEVKIFLNIHKSYRWVVAICDEELLDKKLIEENRTLDLTGNFFKGSLMDVSEVESEIIRCVNEDATFNIVGKNSIEVALRMGIILEEGIMEIQGVPFALSLL